MINPTVGTIIKANVTDENDGYFFAQVDGLVFIWIQRQFLINYNILLCNVSIVLSNEIYQFIFTSRIRAERLNTSCELFNTYNKSKLIIIFHTRNEWLSVFN